MPNFPTSLDTLTNPTSSDTLASPAHATQHADANDIIEAVETKLGTGASVPTTVGHVLTVTGAGATAYQSASGIYTGVVAASGVTYVGVPGIALVSAGTRATAANRTLYYPFLAGTSITVTELFLEVTAAGAGGTTILLGIFEADASWQPGGLVVDAGTVAADAVAVVSKTLSETIPAGRYLMALNSTGAPTLRTYRGGAQYFGSDPILGNAPFVAQVRATETIGAFPSSGTAFTVFATASSGMDYNVLMEWTA